MAKWSEVVENNGLMRIGELARRAGITQRTIGYYEELGLIEQLGLENYLAQQIKE